MNAVNTPQLGDVVKVAVADHHGAQAADLDAARVIATEAVLRFDTDVGPAADRFRNHGIWDDHPAVVAALAAIRIARETRPAAAAGNAELLAEAPLPWRAETDDAASFNDTVEIWDASGAYVAEVDLREYERDSDGTTIGHRIAALIVDTMNAQQVDERAAAIAALAAENDAPLPWRAMGDGFGCVRSDAGKPVLVVAIDDRTDWPTRDDNLARLIVNAVNTAAGFPPVAASQ